MNRATFFTALRKRNSGVFGTSLSQRQVDGIEALLDAGQGFPIDHIAHVFGEIYHETGGGMYPVKETVFAHSKNKNPSDAQVIARLDRAWARGQLPWVRSAYWRGGWFGRGFIQITHRINYRNASALVGLDLVSNPHKALELKTSAIIAMEGCRAGIFTGKKLADFDRFEGYNHVGARAIVNGDKNKREKGAKLTNGEKVAAYARAFRSALIEAGYSEHPQPPLDHVPAPTPTKTKQGPLAALIAALAAIFGGKT